MLSSFATSLWLESGLQFNQQADSCPKTLPVALLLQTNLRFSPIEGQIMDRRELLKQMYPCVRDYSSVRMMTIRRINLPANVSHLRLPNIIFPPKEKFNAKHI